MKYLGKIIHELRLEKNLTIETLAYHAGISVSHMGYIERGTKTNIQMDTLKYRKSSRYKTLPITPVLRPIGNFMSNGKCFSQLCRL